MKIALIWVSNDKQKYWNKILNDLINKWYTVYPVNPKEDIIEWIKAFKSIDMIKNNFLIANFVVNPKITLDILQKNLVLLKDKTIWCQPWASDEFVKIFLRDNNFKNYITDSCIMLQKIN